MAREQVPSPLPCSTDGESVARVAALSSLSSATDVDDDDPVMRIYLDVNAAFTAGRFGEVDAMLAAVDVPSESIVDLLAWVSITQAASEHLPGRAAFVANVRQHLTATDPERVEALMRGFS